MYVVCIASKSLLQVDNNEVCATCVRHGHFKVADVSRPGPPCQTIKHLALLFCHFKKFDNKRVLTNY